MAKSELEKALEKQTRAAQKVAREEEIRATAQAVVNGAMIVSGFRVMDQESEDLLAEILEQYDGNKNNNVNFNSDILPKHLQDSISVGYKKLEMYGMISNVFVWMSGASITLSESGKLYFDNKEMAYENEQRKTLIDMENRFKKYDVFISHANQDKLLYVEELYESLAKFDIKIWYDTNTLSWGDSFKKKILEGTQKSEFAIIVISNHFFDREWTEKELNEFLQRQNETGQKIILPLLHDITLDDLKSHYPELADIKALFTNEKSTDEIAILFVNELIKRLRT